MSFVLDASAALAWVFERADPSEALEARSLLDRLRTDEAIVPELWRLEVLNALIVGCRRNVISAYDGAYLDLALHTQSASATFDRRLAAARDKIGLSRP
jgi:predicted nucleic acid-binding protein